MINTDNAKVLEAIASANVKMSLNITYLTERARKLPYCKKNILLTKIIFWNKIYNDIIKLLLDDYKSNRRNLDANPECLKYIIDNHLANKTFAEFFFNFHEPLTHAFLHRLDIELTNGLPYDEKFKLIASEISELLNLARIELEALDISCETFGGEPMCPSYKKCGVNDCIDASNIFFIMLNEEYLIEPDLFDKIVNKILAYLKVSKEDLLLIVDYRNIERNDYVFAEEGRKRYDKILPYVAGIYFYHTDKVTFAHCNKDLVKYIIPDKDSLKQLKESWRNNKQLITFGEEQ